MHITLNNIDKPIMLNHPIDNRGDKRMKIGLVSARIVYTFPNIESDEEIVMNDNSKVPIKSAFYSKENISSLTSSKLFYEKATGTLHTDDMIKSMGPSLGGIVNQGYTDIYRNNKSISIKANVVSTTDNLYNGKGSDILFTGYVPNNTNIGDVLVFEPKNVLYKNLKYNSVFHELSLQLVDNIGNVLDPKLDTEIVLEIL